MTKVLFVLTGAKEWRLKDGSKHCGGVWSPEFVYPHDCPASALVVFGEQLPVWGNYREIVRAFRLPVTLGCRSTRALLRKASKHIWNASGITTTNELPTNAGAGRGLSFPVIKVIGFFIERPCSPAAASLGTIWRLNILQIKSRLLINSSRAPPTLSAHIIEPAVCRILLTTKVLRKVLNSMLNLAGGHSTSCRALQL